MNVLTHTSYKAHYDLYIEIHGSIAANSCQIRLTQKNIILLSKAPLITCKAGKPKGVENKNLIYSRIPAGTFSIDDFNTKIKEFVLQQRQDWEPLQIKDLKLFIPKHYTFLADNTIFITLGIPDKYIEKTVLIRSTLPPGSYKTSLDTSPPPISLSLHCKQINKVKSSN